MIPESGNPARDIYKAMVMDMDMAVAEIVANVAANPLLKLVVQVVNTRRPNLPQGPKQRCG